MQIFKNSISDFDYFKIILPLLVVIACIILIVTSLIEPLDGDLTRVGLLREADFGPNLLQPVVKILSNDIDPLVVDTIILGDSYSKPNIWQSLFTSKTGSKTKTFAWESLPNYSCLTNWIQQLKVHYPNTKRLILQTVEREYFARFSEKQVACGPLRYAPVPVIKGMTKSERSRRMIESIRYPSYSFQALINEVDYSKDVNTSGKVVLQKLNNDTLFSNEMSNVILLYKDDFLSQNWSKNGLQEAEQNLVRLSEISDSSGIRMFLLIIPDKTTIYKNFLVVNSQRKSESIYDNTTYKLPFSIPVVERLKKEALIHKDLYKPNDSHLSTSGYIILNDVIIKNVLD